MNNPRLVHWQTPCSASEELYFNRLIDEDHPIFSVDNGRDVFDFIFEFVGPYQVVDEAFLTYEPAKDPGNTFIVEDSVWAQSFSGLLENVYFPNGLTHYLILTNDACFEALAPKPPIIEVRHLEQMINRNIE